MLKRFMILSTMMVILAAFASAQSSTEAEARSADGGKDAKLERALASKPDQYGIPVELYTVDRSLRMYQKRIKGGETVGLVLGLAGGGLVAGGVALGLAAPDFVWAPSNIPTPIPYGFFLAGLGGVAVVVDLAVLLPGIEKDKKTLVSVYQKKYGDE